MNNIQSKPKTNFRQLLKKAALHSEPGLDGILVTIGLCVIALLLCVVMKDSLASFIDSIIVSMSNKASEILDGTTAAGMIGGLL